MIDIKGNVVYCLLILLFAIILFVVNFLLHKLFNKEYKKTIKRCTYHVLGKISENNCIWERKYMLQGRNASDTIYHIVLKYVFTIDNTPYEKASTWKLRTR